MALPFWSTGQVGGLRRKLWISRKMCHAGSGLGAPSWDFSEDNGRRRALSKDPLRGADVGISYLPLLYQFLPIYLWDSAEMYVFPPPVRRSHGRGRNDEETCSGSELMCSDPPGPIAA